MKILYVYKNLLGEWCAGTHVCNTVYALNAREAIRKWRSENPNTRVKVEIENV